MKQKVAGHGLQMAASDRFLRVFTILFASIMVLLTLYPLYFVVIASFSDPNSVVLGKVVLLPDAVNLKSYQRVFNHTRIWTAYKNTLIYTLTYTALNVFATMTAAFVFSRKKLVGGRVCLLLVLFTMYFSGGMIPGYFNIRNLGLLDSMWALVLPGAISTYNMIIARTYISTSIPDALSEAATIDGCQPLTYFFRIVLPLSGPIIGVLTLYAAVGMWNSYFSALLYIQSENKLPLQMILREILVQSEISPKDMLSASDVSDIVSNAALKEQLKYALVVVASVPMLVLYPFLQKFFVKGVMVGSLKG